MSSPKEDFFNELKLLAEKLDTGTEPSERNATLAEQVVALMSLKIANLSRGAVYLLTSGFYPESIILLRSAYECLVMSKYLQQKPDEIARYEAHGVLCNLRNMLEFQMQNDFEPETRTGLQAQIDDLKTAFCQSGIAFYPDLQPTDLDNFSKVRKASNKALFSQLPSMLTATEWTDEDEWIKTSFELYNIGSQVTHSQMEWLAIGEYGRSEHAIYSRLAVSRYLLMFLNEISQTMTSLGLCSKFNREIFENKLGNCLQLLTIWLTEEQTSMVRD